MSVNTYDKEHDVLNKISGGGSAHRILNSDGTVSSQRPNLQFGAGFSVSDDTTDEKTIVTSNAASAPYDNTESELDAENVQDAIDEVAKKVGDTDISSIGDGTATGAIAELNSNLTTKDITSSFSTQTLITGITATLSGKTVTLSISGTMKQSTTYIINLLPSEYRPKEKDTVYGFALVGSDLRSIIVENKVYFSGAYAPADTNVVGFATWHIS